MGVAVFWFHMGAWKMNLEVCFWCALYLVEALFRSKLNCNEVS